MMCLRPTAASTARKSHARALPPAAVPGVLRAVGDGVVGVEAPKVVDAQHVVDPHW